MISNCPFIAGGHFYMGGVAFEIIEAGPTKNVGNAERFPWVLKLRTETARGWMNIAACNDDLVFYVPNP